MNQIKPRIAFIDDEERILRTLKMHFRDTHDVFTTTNPDALLEYVKQHDVQVVVSDQRMPQRLGVDVLKDVKEVSPHTVRILLTGYADLNAVVNSINEGEIYRYVAKPWDDTEIVNTVRDALEAATTGLRELEEQRMKLEHSLEPLRERIGELKLKEQAASLNFDQLAAQLAEVQADEQSLAIDLPGARPAALQGSITSLQRQIEALGAVNLAALDELESAQIGRAHV